MSDTTGSNSPRAHRPISNPIMIPVIAPKWKIDRSIDLRYPPVIDDRSAEVSRTYDKRPSNMSADKCD